MRCWRAGCLAAPLLCWLKVIVVRGFACLCEGDVILIFAGWLPQDGAFGSKRHACLASSVAAGQGAAHRCIASRPGRCLTP